MNKKDVAYIHNVANWLDISIENVLLFRRDSMRLHNWFKQECGDSNAHADWCIERDPDTDKPYRITNYYGRGNVSLFRRDSMHLHHITNYYGRGTTRRTPIPDMEKGARKRISERCERLGLHFYIQTDPRGWALYLSRNPINDTNYTNGFGIGA